MLERKDESKIFLRHFREVLIREMMTHLRAQTKKLFIELMVPPGMLGKYPLPCYGNTGIDLTNLSFVPLQQEKDQEPYLLTIVADIYGSLTPAMETAVKAAVYGLLGEKRVGEQLKYITVDRLVNYSTKKRTTLINLNE